MRQPTKPTETPAVTILPATTREVLEAILKAYSFVDSADELQVTSILAQSPDVSAILLDALPHVYAIFGDTTAVRLISVADHSGGRLTLSARIQSHGALAEQLAHRDIFYRTWWNEASGAVLGDLSFGV